MTVKECYEAMGANYDEILHEDDEFVAAHARADIRRTDIRLDARGDRFKQYCGEIPSGRNSKARSARSWTSTTIRSRWRIWKTRRTAIRARDF